MKQSKKSLAEQKRLKELRLLFFKYNFMPPGTTYEEKQYLNRLAMNRRARQRRTERVEALLRLKAVPQTSSSSKLDEILKLLSDQAGSGENVADQSEPPGPEV